MMEAVEFGATFTSYLREPSARSAGAVAVCLEHDGREPDAALLRAHAERGAHWTPAAGGPLPADRCWVGLRPPADPRAGDLWFDAAEIVTAVLVPRPEDDELTDALRVRLTPFTAWLATRPVADWQVAGVAARIGPVPSGTAATALIGVQAARYAAVFGKSLATAEDWSAARTALGAEAVRRLWGGDHAVELGGYVGEGLLATIALEDILTAVEEPAEDEAELDEGEVIGMPFRTHVSTQIGLLPSIRA